jgi:DNA mismatch endonuclease (patch repair protein)
MPRGNNLYWQKKIERNRIRDREVTRALKKGHWRVFRVWEHSLGRGDLIVTRIKTELKMAVHNRVATHV